MVSWVPNLLPDRLKTQHQIGRSKWKITSFRERFMEIFCHTWTEDDYRVYKQTHPNISDYEDEYEGTIDTRFVKDVEYLLREWLWREDEVEYQEFSDEKRKSIYDCLDLFNDFHGYIRMTKYMNTKEKSLWSGRIIKKIWNDESVREWVFEFFEYYNTPDEVGVSWYMRRDRWLSHLQSESEFESDSEDEVWEDQQPPVPPEYEDPPRYVN